MSGSLISALVWLVSANVIGMLPSKHHHWPSAYVLITLGIPILAGVFWQEGIVIGLIVLAMAVSVLRWPVRYLIRWIRRVGSPRAVG